MTTHVSKEQLGLMMPGTMDHYFQNEPEYLAAPRPGLLAKAAAAIGAWISRRAAIEEVAALSDAQLADIGISRCDAPMVFDRRFAAQREQDRIVAMLQTGRIAGM